MRDDHKKALKKIKQQIGMFCMRHGYYYEGTKWMIAHLKWLKKHELTPMCLETLDEYLASYEEQTAKIERFDARIEEIASQTEYVEKVKKLGCLIGIKTHTALSLKQEILQDLQKEMYMRHILDWRQGNIPARQRSTDLVSLRRETVTCACFLWKLPVEYVRAPSVINLRL